RRAAPGGRRAPLEGRGERRGKAGAAPAPLPAELVAARRRACELEGVSRELTLERDRLLAENELVHQRVADLFASNEDYYRKTAELQAEVKRLNDLLSRIYASRSWKLHLWAERFRGRR